MRILIVDDEEMMCEVLTAGLRGRGHITVCCETAAEALPMIAYVDAVICDGLDGGCWTVLMAAECLDKPAVLLTGDDALVSKASRICIPALLKPAKMEQILFELTRVRVPR